MDQLRKSLQHLCSRQEKCIADIQDYMIRHEVPADFHASIIEQLIKDKFIDESRYARAVVHDKYKLNRWGRKKIVYFLKSKKIPEEIINEAMASIDEKAYRKIIKDELQKKEISLKGEKPDVKRMKLLQFAMARGYEAEIAKEYIHFTG